MMGRVMGQVFRLVVVLVLAAGCEKSEGGNDGATGVTGSGGASMGEPTTTPTCLAEVGCTCENGELGQTVCEGEAVSCACEACPAFAPATSAAFEPCGGEPAGIWSSGGYDLSGVVAHFGVAVGDATASTACPADFVELAPPSLRLVMNANGSAEVGYVAPELYGTILESCILSELAQRCEQVPQCTDTGCGTCGCTLENRSFSSATAKWSQQGTRLQVGPMMFDYCVEGRAMTVVNRDNGMRFELEQLVVPEQKCTGAPAECGKNKNEKDCKLVRGCIAAGACAGDAVRTCDYAVDVCTICPAGCNCEVNLGESQCSGVAHCADMTNNADCLGLGCEWQAFAGCDGTPDPCDGLTVEECRFTPGCKVQ